MWPNPQETGDLVTFTEEILNGKLHFLCSVTAKDLSTRRKYILVEFMDLVVLKFSNVLSCLKYSSGKRFQAPIYE